ncbi:hypothetical protein K2X85_17270 [bacterium]|nr:hypothetical protein [bacterium]
MFARKCIRSLMLALLFFTTSVSAFDLFPAPFRGEPGTVYGFWDFTTPANPALPEAWNIVPLGNYPVFQIPMGVEISSNMVYLNDGNINGWISTPGAFNILNFVIPNFVDFEPVKKLWIQVGYYNFNPNEVFPFVAAIEANDNEAGFVLGELTGSFTVPSIGYRLETWEIRPNPDFELVQFIVPPWVLVDKVTIDTISVPEASSMLLIGMVGLGFGSFYAVRSRRQLH